MSHYLTIAYLDGEAQIVLDQRSKRSEHNKRFKSLSHENSEFCEKVEMWSQARGRIRVKNFKKSKVTPASISGIQEKSLAPASGEGDLTKEAGSSAEHADTQALYTHTTADQPAEAEGSTITSDESAGQSDGGDEASATPELPENNGDSESEGDREKSSDESDSSSPADAVDERSSTPQQPELVGTPPQKGRKAAKNAGKTKGSASR